MEEETSPMKVMRERLFDIVAGLSLRRSASLSTSRPVPAQTAANTGSTQHSHTKRNVSTSAWCTDDADDELCSSRPEPLKLKKKPKRRALG